MINSFPIFIGNEISEINPTNLDGENPLKTTSETVAAKQPLLCDFVVKPAPLLSCGGRPSLLSLARLFWNHTCIVPSSSWLKIHGNTFLTTPTILLKIRKICLALTSFYVPELHEAEVQIVGLIPTDAHVFGEDLMHNDDEVQPAETRKIGTGIYYTSSSSLFYSFVWVVLLHIHTYISRITFKTVKPSGALR